MTPAVRVSGIGKHYRRYPTRWSRLLEWASFGRRVAHEAHWVLRDISFEVAPGESLGVIGQNGAGKSTLLKILTGTTNPSTGSVAMHGRIAALLELGMGFHPDFSGRQNAVMSGQLLGFSAAEVEALMPEIEAFAEIGDYIDQPVRTYSSGMQVRLAFSVATAVRPDILIVDEALSVGDAYFQHKCFDRIRAFRAQGTTLLFVSHDPGAVKNLCDRAVLIEKGQLLKDGLPEEVLDYYNAMIATREADYAIRASRDGSGKAQLRSGGGEASIRHVTLSKDGLETAAVQVGDTLDLAVGVEFHARLEQPTVGLLFKDRLGNELFGTNTFHLGVSPALVEAGSHHAYRFRLPVNFGVGHYSLTVAVHAGATHVQGNYDWWEHARMLQVVPGPQPAFIGTTYLPIEAEVRPLELSAPASLRGPWES